MPPPPIFTRITNPDDDAHEFALVERFVDDAVTFLPPAMRAEFSARVMGIAGLACQAVAIARQGDVSSPELTLRAIRHAVDVWRSDASKIRRIFP